MPVTIKFFRIRLLILAALITVAVGFATEPSAAVACSQCVFPTGGICVGCMEASGRGYVTCNPDQSTCSCTVGGGSCEGGIGGEGGGS